MIKSVGISKALRTNLGSLLRVKIMFLLISLISQPGISTGTEWLMARHVAQLRWNDHADWDGIKQPNSQQTIHIIYFNLLQLQPNSGTESCPESPGHLPGDVHLQIAEEAADQWAPACGNGRSKTTSATSAEATLLRVLHCCFDSWVVLLIITIDCLSQESVGSCAVEGRWISDFQIPWKRGQSPWAPGPKQRT